MPLFAACVGSEPEPVPAVPQTEYVVGDWEAHTFGGDVVARFSFAADGTYAEDDCFATCARTSGTYTATETTIELVPQQSETILMPPTSFTFYAGADHFVRGAYARAQALDDGGATAYQARDSDVTSGAQLYIWDVFWTAHWDAGGIDQWNGEARMDGDTPVLDNIPFEVFGDGAYLGHQPTSSTSIGLFADYPLDLAVRFDRVR